MVREPLFPVFNSTMGRPKNKAKEPVILRRREIKNGNVSLYLAINVDGRRSYEYLKLYLVTETSAEARRANKETLRVANSLKAQRTLEVQAGRFGLQAVGAGGDVLLRETPCGNLHVRDAFMFSCLTGLRWSDVVRLRWSDVTVEGGVPRIVFRQKKTRGLEYMDINSQAYDILKGRGEQRRDSRKLSKRL